MSDNEGIAVPGEGAGESLAPVEVKARASGWKPLDEYRGDPEDWVDAKEFVGREKLFAKIRDLKGEVHRVKTKADKDFEVVSQHLASTEERAFKRAKEELKAQRKAAVKAGEAEEAEELDEALEVLEEDRKRALAAIPKPTVQSGPTPEFNEFQEANPWFKLGEKGPENEMTEDAIAIGTGYAAANPRKSQSEVLAHVAKKVKTMYPEEFGGVQRETKTRSEPVVETGTGGSRGGNSGGKKTKIQKSDLNSQQRQIMETLIKRGALKDKAAKNKVSQETQYLMDLGEVLEQ